MFQYRRGYEKARQTGTEFAGNTKDLSFIKMKSLLRNAWIMLKEWMRISDPPRVGPGATVLIFRIAGGARMTGGNPAGPAYQSAPTDETNSQLFFPVNSLGSKILSTFKLPKFDGNARQWKTWDNSFVRYLSVHQLDFVLEESF
jgi:hypothetical protein